MLKNMRPKFNPWCAAANVVERTRRAQIPEFFTAPNIFSSPSPAPPVRANKFQLEFSYKSEQEILVTTCFYHNIKTPEDSSIMLEIYKSKTHTQPPIPLPPRPIRQHCLLFRRLHTYPPSHPWAPSPISNFEWVVVGVGGRGRVGG